VGTICTLSMIPAMLVIKSEKIEMMERVPGTTGRISIKYQSYVIPVI